MRKRRPGQIFNARMLLACFILMVSMQYIASYLIIVVANFRPDWYESYNQLFESAGMNDMTVLLTVYAVTVSYTHLDVYKRQIHIHFSQFQSMHELAV